MTPNPNVETSTVSIEWGVRRTWLDGHTEITKCDSRMLAEAAVRMTKGAGGTRESAIVVSRTVTVAGWTLIAS